uniref:FERM and PDZ domain-containing protein 2 n=1 Tax=Syphacia muris TaxID=451379 RepID=A0A0N5B0F9_9BILA
MNAPLVRLKAPAMRKKKVSLHRVEQTVVVVELLNGKRVEVNCRSDAIAAEIADVVMRHINFNENIFFGLTHLRDGEHFFFDDNQRIEKFAPPGWKSGRQHGYSSQTYILHLKFRYYPASLQFVRTDVVLYELYFQLRQDILNDWLQPFNEASIELAALALQAEYGDRTMPQTVDYFQLEHYLPRRCFESEDEIKLRKTVCELHGKLKGISGEEARNKFILICQRLPDYGAHFHRVFRSKPSTNLGNTPLGDPETGTAEWIAIMPTGIVEYEERRGRRHPTVNHLWQNTQTLQFDKKQFVIVSDVHKPSHSIFYTDHYTKSAYFVRFAASQHRFMIKMRNWSKTLQNDGTLGNRNIPDVGAESTANSDYDSSSKANVDKTNEIEQLKTLEKVVDVSSALKDCIPETNNNETINGSTDEPSVEESIESEDGKRFEVSLEKDRNLGLGLTLVDGNLNGVKGVYVKAVAEGGAGKKSGITGGDRLLSVNGVSLIGKDRHETVELVRNSGTTVKLEIFRLESVSRALLPNRKKTEISSHTRSISAASTGLAVRSRTPPLARKNVTGLKKRVRAVSDFGAVGDTLPDLKSEDVIANIRSNSSEDEEDIKDSFRLPASAIYKFESVDEENMLFKTPNKFEVSSSYVGLSSSFFSPKQKTNANGFEKTLNKSSNSSKSDYMRRTKLRNLDWADELNRSQEINPLDLVLVELRRNETGSLGVQIASSGGSVYVKQLTANPALSHSEVKIGDRLIEVNGRKTENLTHQQVVDLLKNGGENVTLLLQHCDENGCSQAKEESEKLIRVVLQKSSTGSLGLSLAKKTGYDGIFIRTIETGSAADIDGTLLVGDKVWEVNGQSVANNSPGSVVELLKGPSQSVEIVVKRSV